MDNSGPVLGGDKVCTVNAEGRIFSLQEGKELLILGPQEGFTLQFFENLRPFPQNRRHPLTDQNVDGVFIRPPRFHVGISGINRQGHVGRERPRGCGPDQEVLVLFAHHLHPDIDRVNLLFFIAEGNLVGGQGRPTPAAVGHDLVALIDQPGLKIFLQNPPDAFDIIVV